MTWITVWLGGAAVYFTGTVCLGIIALATGRWVISGAESGRQRVVHTLSLVKDWSAEALVWPLTLLVLFIKLPTIDMDQLREMAEDVEPLRSGTIDIPPQDERSQQQLSALDAHLRGELSAALAVDPIVKFYPLLRLSWEEFQRGLPAAYPMPLTQQELAAQFLAFAQGFTRGTLK